MTIMRFLLFLLTTLSFSCSAQPEKPAKKNMTMTTESISADGLEVATLGGGCFWCVEAVYQNLNGVHSVVSGYSGGSAETANYKSIGSGRTEHAEVIQIQFDPKTVSFEEILEVFWHVHDPTTLNRQGNDVGPQYRSVIFYHSKEQKQTAEQSKKEVAPELWDKPIVTEISAFKAFYEAEAEHQDYYNRVGDRNPYCTYVITPKVQKFQKVFKDKLKEGN
jgi:peptide-methionine (S)-S-oxide reductase